MDKLKKQKTLQESELSDEIKQSIALRRQLIMFYDRDQLMKVYEYNLKNPNTPLTKPLIDEILGVDIDGKPLKTKEK